MHLLLFHRQCPVKFQVLRPLLSSLAILLRRRLSYQTLVCHQEFQVIRQLLSPHYQLYLLVFQVFTQARNRR